MDRAVAFLVGQLVAQRELEDDVVHRPERTELGERATQLGDVLTWNLDAASLAPRQLAAGSHADTLQPVGDPVAETQRIAGAVLGYMTKMGVASSIVEAMSETRDIRWLGPKEALAMNLITDPVGRP